MATDDQDKAIREIAARLCGDLGDYLSVAEEFRRVEAALREACEWQREQDASDFREVLEQHWLASIECHHIIRSDTATCACGKWHCLPQATVGLAVHQWISHVLEQAAIRRGGQ